MHKEGRPYFSQRQGKAVIRDREDIGERFWKAFVAYVGELAEKNYFAEAFPVKCPDVNGICSWSGVLLQSRILGELPEGEWPLPERVPARGTVFDYVEFFHRVVSVPSGRDHPFFGHTDYRGFDQAQAQSEYSLRINQYLQTCRYPYDLVDGEVRPTISPVLDRPLKEAEFALDDQHLSSLLQSAVSDFFDRSGNRKRKALESLVDAFDRLKTIERGDKRQSVQTIISKLSAIEAVRRTLDEDMRVLTDISNEFTVRHHEMHKRQLGDDDFVEYLFYAYYNVIRLILKKYGRLRTVTKDK